MILTNTRDCPPNLRGHFYDTLKNYISFRAQSNICYCVLDLANQRIKHAFNPATIRSVEFVVDILKEISKVATPQYIMIIGDRNAIDSIRWYNPLINYGDHDEYVHSDLPYITLDTTSSFQRAAFNFEIEVGRLPSSAKTGFEEARIYLANAMRLHNSSNDIRTLVSTAIQWTRSSALTYKNISDKELYPCPDVSFIPGSKINRILDNNCAHNLLCFNFHGGPTSNYWFWEDEEVNPDENLEEYYKPAYSPAYLPANKEIAYAICTEACYGAKPTDSKSILMTALQNRCLAYLGSTESAYGAANYVEASLSADILAKNFCLCIHQGYSFGSAFLTALAEMFNPSSLNNVNLHELKTITTFALYGDPTLSLINASTNAINHSPLCQRHYHISLPDIKQLAEIKLKKISTQISRYIDNHVKENYKYFSDAEPHFYAKKNSGGYEVYFSKTTNSITRVLYMYLDDDGTAIKTYMSK